MPFPAALEASGNGKGSSPVPGDSGLMIFGVVGFRV